MKEQEQNTEYLGFRYGSGDRDSLDSSHEHLGDNLIYGSFIPSRTTNHVGYTVTLRTISWDIQKPVPDPNLIKQVIATIRQEFSESHVALLKEPVSSWNRGPVPKGLHGAVVQLTRITFRIPTNQNEKAMGVARRLHRNFLDRGLKSETKTSISSEDIDQLVRATRVEITTNQQPFSEHLNAIERYFVSAAALPNSQFRLHSTLERTANHAAYATNLGIIDLTPTEGKLLTEEGGVKKSIVFFSNDDVTTSLIAETVGFVERRSVLVKQFIRPSIHYTMQPTAE